MLRLTKWILNRGRSILLRSRSMCAFREDGNNLQRAQQGIVYSHAPSAQIVSMLCLSRIPTDFNGPSLLL